MRSWRKIKNYLALIFTILHNLISTNLLKFILPAPSQLFLLIITSPGPSPSAFFFFFSGHLLPFAYAIFHWTALSPQIHLDKSSQEGSPVEALQCEKHH